MRQTRRAQSGRSKSNGRRQRHLLLVFALIFAPAATRPARAACVEFAEPPAIDVGTNHPSTLAATDLDGDGDLDALAAVLDLDLVAWFENLGTKFHDDGFDSDANTACWSSAVP